PRAQLPRVRDVLREGWYYLIPLAILVYFLLVNVSPNRVGFIATVAILAISAVRWAIRRWILKPSADETTLPRASVATDTWTGARGFINAFRVGALNAVPVTIACAVAGVVVGIITLTGLGLKFSALMLAFSGGNLLLALLLLILASLVLGMGLPVTASYIV